MICDKCRMCAEPHSESMDMMHGRPGSDANFNLRQYLWNTDSTLFFLVFALSLFLSLSLPGSDARCGSDNKSAESVRRKRIEVRCRLFSWKSYENEHRRQQQQQQQQQSPTNYPDANGFLSSVPGRPFIRNDAVDAMSTQIRNNNHIATNKSNVQLRNIEKTRKIVRPKTTTTTTTTTFAEQLSKAHIARIRW